MGEVCGLPSLWQLMMKIIYPCPILCPCTLFKQPWGRDTEQISSAEEKLPLYLLSPRSQINLLNKLNYDIIVALIDFKIGLLLSGRLSKSVLHTAHVHQTRLTYLVSRTSFKIRGVIQCYDSLIKNNFFQCGGYKMLTTLSCEKGFFCVMAILKNKKY